MENIEIDQEDNEEVKTQRKEEEEKMDRDFKIGIDFSQFIDPKEYEEMNDNILFLDEDCDTNFDREEEEKNQKLIQ